MLCFLKDMGIRMKNKGNIRGKQCLFIAIGIIILICSLIMVNNILEYKSPHGVNQARAFYLQPRNSIEVLAVGSSHVHCAVNTAELWDKYGIAAFDYSAAEQPLWTSYYYLKEAYKYQSPKVVLLDVFSPARFKEDYHYKWAEESIYGMRLSKNKLDMLGVTIEGDKIKQYFPGFYQYHNRYENLNKSDFENVFGNLKEKKAFKGFTPAFNRADQSSEFDGWEELSDYELSEKSEEYLNKIIALTKENNSSLYIIVIPYNMDERDNITYRKIQEISENEGVYFIDFNRYMDEMGLDKSQDFNDPSHLNYWGSQKFSDYLGKILLEKEALNDYRSTGGYESWNDNLQNILEQTLGK